MMKLPEPNWTTRETCEKCIAGMGDSDLQERVARTINELVELASDYEKKALDAQLFSIQELPPEYVSSDQLTGELCKDELLGLYEKYLRGKSKPGRDIYDAIIRSAGYKCPYCGGLGEPRNIDHYLPKTAFPQFSVIPLNLVPACRDCNMEGKGAAHASTEADQVIHPYLDRSRFFLDQWLEASLLYSDPCSLRYSVSVPTHWNKTDEDRAIKHFYAFALDRRYSVYAAAELSSLVYERRTILRGISPKEFSEHLSTKANEPLFPNHWKRIMYQTLAKNVWFCRQSF